MTKQYFCDECKVPMELLERLPSVRSKKGGTYRRRRFKCKVCDNVVIVYAEGSRDIDMEPLNAQDEINEMYKQQEENERK